MLVNDWLKLRNSKQLSAIMFTALLGGASAADATEINADVVMNKMNSDQRVSYVSGVIEGLAYARFVRDKPDETGMKCIYDWYYADNDKRWKETLFPVFDRHKDKPVGVILHVLTKKACGA